MAGKWAAAVLLGGLYASIAITSLYVVIGLGPRDWRHGAVPSFTNYLIHLSAALIAVAGYASVGCFLAAIFRRPMLVSVIYIFVEQFASRLPAEANLHTATIASPVRSFLYTTIVEPSRTFKEILDNRIDGTPEEELEAMIAGDPLMSLLKLIGFVLLVTLWVYCRREYDSRPRE